MPAETQPWFSDLIPGAIVFVIALGVLGYLFRRMRRTQKSVYRSAPADPAHGVSCPRCGGAMDRGYVSAPRGIIWRDPQQRPVGLMFRPWEVLDNTLNMSLTPLHNLAWRCPACQMLTIDHAGLIRAGRD